MARQVRNFPEEGIIVGGIVIASAQRRGGTANCLAMMLVLLYSDR